MTNPEDAAYFDESGPDVHADLQWIIIAAYFLIHFEQVIPATAFASCLSQHGLLPQDDSR
jgi:hypothetical protein